MTCRGDTGIPGSGACSFRLGREIRLPAVEGREFESQTPGFFGCLVKIEFFMFPALKTLTLALT